MPCCIGLVSSRKWSSNELQNPIADTELPTWKVSDQTNDVRAPSIEEVRSLLISAKRLGARIYAYILLIAATGIRRGEACAIRWGDIDFENEVIQIDESIVMVEGGVLVKGPKSKAGIRRLAVDTATIESLRVLRDQCADLADIAEVALTDLHFVFARDPTEDVPPYPDSMSHAFARIRDDAGVASDVHLHSLRHFHATALDPVISEAQKQARLGWSTVHMARHYTDVIEEEDRRGGAHRVPPRGQGERRAADGTGVSSRRGLSRLAEGRSVASDEPLDGAVRHAQPPVDRHDWDREVAPFDRAVTGRAVLTEERGDLLDA